MDFTLGRFDKPSPDRVMSTCRHLSGRAYWRPTLSRGLHTCNATDYPGYLTMCPGGPHALHRVCEAPDNATGVAHLGKRGVYREGGGGGGVRAAGNTTRDRKRAMREQQQVDAEHSKNPPRSTRDRLLELAQLREEQLISESEFGSLRTRILDGLAVAAPSSTK